MKIFSGFVLIWYWGTAHSLDSLPALDKERVEQKLPLSVRVEKLEKRLSNKALLDMFNQMQDVKKEFQLLQGEIERLTHELENIKKRQRGLYLDLDQRILSLEGVEPSDSGSGYSPLTAPPESQRPKKKEAAGTKGTSSGDERKAYETAYRTLQDGGYIEAIDLFTSFLQQYPAGKYADNAEYWRAEAYYVGRDFQRAKDGFNTIINVYPDSPKAKDGLLKIGFIEYEEKNWGESKRVLNQVLERYPNSTVAKLAVERLNRIRAQGH